MLEILIYNVKDSFCNQMQRPKPFYVAVLSLKQGADVLVAIKKFRIQELHLLF